MHFTIFMRNSDEDLVQV